ncbi:MAG: hypothetical protein NWF08_04765, partial [Candidatus Bathyarchaeota archaeon]|nr:hypothetical protein [Candidatus Bathyarchaeota archaeon]
MDYFLSISPMTHHLDVKKVRKILLALVLTSLLISNIASSTAQTDPVSQIDYPAEGDDFRVGTEPTITGVASDYSSTGL